MEELKVGDRVKITDDSPLARRVLNETFLQCPNARIPQFGGIGYVTKTDISTRDNRVYCMVRPIKPTGDTYGWPAILLEKLPADECENIHQVSGFAAGEAFRKAMLIACGEVKYDFDSVEAAFELMESMQTTPNLSHCQPAKCQCNIQIGPDPSPSTPGVAEIVFDHVVKDGKCVLQIAGIRGILNRSELPLAYFTEYDPAMWGLYDGKAVDGKAVRIVDGEFPEIIALGHIFTEEEAAKLVKRMRACGKRLHDINVAARAKADAARLERWKAKGRKVVRI